MVVLGLGASLGDRRATMRRALWLLQQRGVVLRAISAVYETPALPLPDPSAWTGSLPSFFNAAARVAVPFSLAQLLSHLREVEERLGRQRPDPVRWGPRTIDLDVLWAEGPPHCTPELQVPHPRLCERDFALRPLVEVAPRATDPMTGQRYADLVAARRAMRPRHHRL